MALTGRAPGLPRGLRRGRRPPTATRRESASPGRGPASRAGLGIAATTRSSFNASHVPPANSSCPATTLSRSSQCRAGGRAARSLISSRLAPIRTGQSWAGRRRITTVHIPSHNPFRRVLARTGGEYQDASQSDACEAAERSLYQGQNSTSRSGHAGPSNKAHAYGNYWRLTCPTS